MVDREDAHPVEATPVVLEYAQGGYGEKPPAPPMTFGQKIVWLAGIAAGLSLLMSIGSWSLNLGPLFVLACILWVVVAGMWATRAIRGAREDETPEAKWVDRRWRRVVLVLFLVPLLIMALVPRYTCPHGTVWGVPGAGYAYSANGGPCRNKASLRSNRITGNWYVWTNW